MLECLVVRSGSGNMCQMRKQGWGFERKDMNARIRPQDDFFHYANGGWIKKTKIPHHESRWGSFQILHTETQKKLKALVGEASRSKRLTAGSSTQLVGDLYRSGIDMKARDTLGTRPLHPLRHTI